MFTGGCVSAEKYKDALAANDRISAELRNCHESLEAMRAERDKLRADLAAVEAAMKNKDAMLASLQSEREMLRNAINDLQAKLMAAGEVPLPPIGGPALPEDLDRELKAFAAANPDLVEYDADRGMVKFKTDLLFAPGSDEVAAAAKAALEKFAQIVKSPTASRFGVYVAGHTDNVPIKKADTLKRHPTNWYLSAHRAVSVMEILEASGVPSVRLSVLGFSEFQPVAANAPGNKGNAANRRVEIWIVPPSRMLTSGPNTTPSAVDSEGPAK
jgi:chemotaxis protein MotB